MSVLKTPFHIVQAELGPGIVDNRGMALAQLYSPFSDVLHEASHLFKAAPDLLAACGSAVWVLNNRHNKNSQQWEDYAQAAEDDLRAAIAKAKGECDER